MQQELKNSVYLREKDEREEREERFGRTEEIMREHGGVVINDSAIKTAMKHHQF